MWVYVLVLAQMYVCFFMHISPCSHVESYCSVRIACRSPRLRIKAVSWLRKSDEMPAYSSPSEQTWTEISIRVTLACSHTKQINYTLWTCCLTYDGGSCSLVRVVRTFSLPWFSVFILQHLFLGLKFPLHCLQFQLVYFCLYKLYPLRCLGL